MFVLIDGGFWGVFDWDQNMSDSVVMINICHLLDETKTEMLHRLLFEEHRW